MENEKTPADEFSEMLSNPESEVDVIDDDKVFTIEMSGFFAKRIQSLNTWFTSKKKPEELLAIFERLVQNTDQETKYPDSFSFHFETLLILTEEINNKAREAGAIKKVKMKDMNLGDS